MALVKGEAIQAKRRRGESHFSASGRRTGVPRPC